MSPFREYPGAFDEEVDSPPRMKPNGGATSRGDQQQGESQSNGQTAKFKQEDAWPIMDDAAYYGLAGEIVRTIDPHSEADPVALLVQGLVFFGNVIETPPTIGWRPIIIMQICSPSWSGAAPRAGRGHPAGVSAR
jgi:hypothetical protein